MTRIAKGISDDEAMGRAPADERDSFLDRGRDAGRPLQDRDIEEMDRELKEGESVKQYTDRILNKKRREKKKVDPAEERLAAERDAYNAGERRGNFIQFPQVKYKPKRVRRCKPWSPMDKNDVADPKFDPRNNKRLEIVKRRVLDPFSTTGEHIVVDANLIGDQLGRMFNRGQILKSQFEAGRNIEAMFHATENGDLRSVDVTRDVIDGVQPGYEWSGANRVDNLKKLHDLFERLARQFSPYHAKILWWVIKDGIPLKTIAQHFGHKDHKQILADMKEALDDFALIGRPDKWERFAA
jgi:hypothetical protein